MFDIGWTEILILATICLFVIGPKDIPKFFGYIGKMLGKVRSITSELKESVDDAIKDSELEDIKKEIAFNQPELEKDIQSILNPKVNETDTQELEEPQKKKIKIKKKK